MDDRFRFRAWNRVTKKMVDLEAITPLALCFQMKDGEGGVFLPFTDNMILLQCTGLKDKNGVLIYEGDPCDVFTSNGEHCRAIVQFVEGCFELKFARQIKIGQYYNDRDYLKCWTINHAVRVIGNIYENQELMEGGE
jgi:uncharacterized phage protein (TIGR01671 family)